MYVYIYNISQWTIWTEIEELDDFIKDLNFVDSKLFLSKPGRSLLLLGVTDQLPACVVEFYQPEVEQKEPKVEQPVGEDPRSG